MAEVTQVSLDKTLEQRFALLPKVVQDAILSSAVEKHLRELANTYKLHLDKWQKLENEVMLTLLGMQDPEKLALNIEAHVSIDRETAKKLAEDISRSVFEPIRQALERSLEHPEAKALEVSAVDKMRTSLLKQEPAKEVAPSPAIKAETSSSSSSPENMPQTIPSIIEKTPPPPRKEAPKVMRAPISESYKPQMASTARKAVDGDPYREQID